MVNEIHQTVAVFSLTNNNNSLTGFNNTPSQTVKIMLNNLSHEKDIRSQVLTTAAPVIWGIGL